MSPQHQWQPGRPAVPVAEVGDGVLPVGERDLDLVRGGGPAPARRLDLAHAVQGAGRQRREAVAAIGCGLGFSDLGFPSGEPDDRARQARLAGIPAAVAVPIVSPAMGNMITSIG